jgi:hypothetical protein
MIPRCGVCPPHPGRLRAATAATARERGRAQDAARLMTGKTLYVDSGYHIMDEPIMTKR